MVSSLALSPPPRYPSLQQPILLVWDPRPWLQAEQSKAEVTTYCFCSILYLKASSILLSSGSTVDRKAVCMAQKHWEADKKPMAWGKRWWVRHTIEHLISGRRSHEENFLGKLGHSKAPLCPGEFSNQAHTQCRMHAQKMPEKTLSPRHWLVCRLRARLRAKSLQLCWTLWPASLLRPQDFPGKNTGGGAMSSTRGSSQPGDGTWVSCGSCSAGRFFTTVPPGSVHSWLMLKVLAHSWSSGEIVVCSWYSRKFLSKQ